MLDKLIPAFGDRMKSMGQSESDCKIQVILKKIDKEWKQKKNSSIAWHRDTSCFYYRDFKWYSPNFFLELFKIKDLRERMKILCLDNIELSKKKSVSSAQLIQWEAESIRFKNVNSLFVVIQYFLWFASFKYVSRFLFKWSSNTW